MAKKQFKTESKKLLDMMINSIYTHKEVFLRELISNASDACDKLRFQSLTDDSVKIPLDGYEIFLEADKEAGTLTISDNGCGMTKEELEKNLGTIAKSGSFDFKAEHGEAQGGDKAEDAEETADAEVKAEETELDADANDADKPGEDKKVDIIGQFGVGFYSAFMVADCITVVSRKYGEDTASRWESHGVDGYTIEDCEADDYGTTITLHMKADTDDENYSDFLDEWRIKELIKKYSDYIHYPIRMMVKKSRKIEEPEDKANEAGESKSDSTDDAKASEPKYEEYEEEETLNSMVPLWKKPQSEVSDEEYATFYRDKYFDYEAPLKVIRQKSEGTAEFEALMFIPARAPYDYYSREYEKGLQLYSSGVLIMDKCKDLVPDYFSFVRGLVDSADLSLNISRETLQHDKQLKLIAKALEKKLAGELKKMQKNDREKYEQFFEAFGTQLKYGIYSDYGMHKELLQDLIMFKSSYEAEAEKTEEAKTDADANDTEGEDKKSYIAKLATLREYVERMKEDQKNIYYVAGESVEAMKLLPQVEAVTGRGFEVLYLTEEVDEFALKIMRDYDGKAFANVCADDIDLSTDAEKELLKSENESAKEMFEFMKGELGESVSGVRFTNTLGKHPACLSSEGEISVNMEKTLSKMPGADAGAPKAELLLEINLNHPIAERMKNLYESDKDKLGKYSKILYAQARLISGLSLDNAAEVGEMVCDLMLE